MTSPQRPFLDFYEKHKIIPTSLELSHKKKFFAQRDYLFETLGIPPRLLNGTRILELGPGTGQKAEHLLSLNPTSYKAIDNNPESIKSTQDMIDKSGYSGAATVTSADFLDYVDETRYDLVLAESVIPTQHEPILFLEKLSEKLVAGGLLVFTCMDPMSLLSETLRNAIVKDLNLIDDNLLFSAEKITDFFKEDLDLLPGMNRRRSDWAIDQIIKPPVGPLLDIPTALTSLENTAIFHGSSPRFLEDFRWYKSPEIPLENLSKLALQNYWEKSHNFLDFRDIAKSIKSEDNKKLMKMSSDIYSEVHEKIWTSHSRPTIIRHCKSLKDLISKVSPITAESLESFIKYWDTNDTGDLSNFRPWWGRGTQYVSVIKLK